MPNDLVASRSRATASPAAARSRASSHEAGRSPPLSRTSGSVSRTCLLIERTFLASNYHYQLTMGVLTGPRRCIPARAAYGQQPKMAARTCHAAALGLGWPDAYPFVRNSKAEGGSLSGRT